MTKIESERLICYPISDRSMEALIEKEADPDIKQAYSEMLQGCVRHPEERIWYAVWVMELKHQPGVIVGDFSFKGLGADGMVEIGYGLREGFCGNGYMTEAVRCVSRWALQQKGVTRIEAETEPDNTASKKVLINAGYAESGVIGKEGPRFVYLGQHNALAQSEPKQDPFAAEGISPKNQEETQMFDVTKLTWTRLPKDYTITDKQIEIITNPHTDLWQRTYYHFRNDNAPVLQMATREKYFSFVVKTEFESKHRFDQCGVVMYLNSDNWLKASIEFENDAFQHLGSVATNHGYSDWATTAIDASIKSMWYRLSRREDDFCLECSEDGAHFSQMRVCHMWDAVDEIQFGVYACSPEDSSFKATFTQMDITECKWLAHDGQQPDA